jgi:hypothetical protein
MKAYKLPCLFMMTEEKITAYLLGTLTDGEREEMAVQCFDDEELFRNIQEAEEELTVDYLRDNLSATQLEQFEKNYLTSAQRLENLAFMTALLKHADEHKGSALGWAALPQEAESVSWWKRLTDWRQGLAWQPQMALAALCLAVLVGGLWLAAGRRPAAVTGEPMVLALKAGSARGVSESANPNPVISLAGLQNRNLRLQLLAKFPGSAYQATLERQEHYAKVSPNPSVVLVEPNQVTVEIPASLLAQGYYHLTLHEGNSTEPLRPGYFFEVVP